MEIKVMWELKDIEPGLHVRVPVCNEAWMIGYDSSVISSEKYRLISTIDGMISGGQYDKVSLVDFLNSHEYVPVYILDVLGEK